jgi:hypothetical protein
LSVQIRLEHHEQKSYDTHYQSLPRSSTSSYGLSRHGVIVSFAK